MTCPPALHDPLANAAGRNDAIRLAQYGSAGPAGQACLNCRYYDAATVRRCQPSSRGVGYCERFDFVAAAGAWCRAWAPRRG